MTDLLPQSELLRPDKFGDQLVHFHPAISPRSQRAIRYCHVGLLRWILRLDADLYRVQGLPRPSEGVGGAGSGICDRLQGHGQKSRDSGILLVKSGGPW